MSICEFNGISIAYELYPAIPSHSSKDAETIVLINGLADSKETWALQIPEFNEAGYTVLAFDNRGIGQSSSPPGPYTAKIMADDCKALVSELRGRFNHPHFHLMGVSMGGMIAQQYALDYPEDLLSLTLACTYAAPGPFCSRMFSMWADAAPIMGVPYVMRDVTLWSFTNDFFSDPTRAQDLREVEESMKFMTQTTPAYLAQLNVIQTFDVTNQISTIEVPTLVMAGEGDILIPVALSKKIHELIAGSTWMTVRGGHGCMWEFPRSFNEAYLGFLKQIKSRAAS